MPIKQDAVVAIIQKEDVFLFIKRSNYIDTAAGYWCPVSGRLEENETQIEALEREVMEEVGLSVKALKKICQIPSHNNQFILHFWTTEIISGEASVASDEATDFKWVTLEQMKQLHPVFEEDIQVFEKLVGDNKN